MKVASLMSAPTPSGPSSGSVSAGQAAGSKQPGMFDALVTANAAANDGAASATPLFLSDQPKASEAAEPASTDASVLSAATLAMLAALDRSATMLSPTKGTSPAGTVPTGTDGDEGVPEPVDPGNALATPQSAALMSAFMAVREALPTATVALPGLSGAISAELRPLLNAKAEPVGNRTETTPQAVKESPDGVAVFPSASTMIRDLASMLATSVSPSTPTDGVAVDRHLDLARDDAWLNDLARDIAATAASGGRLKFGLAPESLGRLDVEIRQGQAGVSVHMTTRTDTARDVLTAAQPRIVDEIRAQGVRVAGTEVSTDASGSGSGFGGDRAGSTPRQPFALPIDVARSAPIAALPKTPESVADGRYA